MIYWKTDLSNRLIAYLLLNVSIVVVAVIKSVYTAPGSTTRFIKSFASQCGYDLGVSLTAPAWFSLIKIMVSSSN